MTNKLISVKEKLIKEFIKREKFDSLALIDVSDVEDFSHMFEDSKIESLECISNWNVSNGKNFSWMFSNCQNIKSIKPLKNWNFSNGLSFFGMFNGCSNLETDENLQKFKNIINE